MSGQQSFIITGKALERYFDLNQMHLEFHKLFNFQTENDRAIAIIGGSFLETLLEHVLFAFLPENEKSVQKLVDVNQPLGNFSNKIGMCFCLGLIERVIKDDLTIVRKIRNRFAHELNVSFEDEQIRSWCNELRWHKIALFQEPPKSATARDIYQVGVNQLLAHLSGQVGIARGQKRQILDSYYNI